MDGLFGSLGETPADASRVGGKAAALARMARAGLPVPPAIVIAREHADRALLAADPHGALAELARRWPRIGADFAAAVLDPMAEAVRSLPVDARLALALVEGARRIGRGAPLILRSSATDEDAAGGSAAGQHLSIAGLAPEQVPAALARCWASVLAPGAWAYRGARARDGFAPPSMAAVLMPFVEFRVSGVLFTRAPDAGDDLLVEAVLGACEALVSGHATPVRLRLPRRGPIPAPSPPGDEVMAALAPHLDALRQRALACEALFGGPQDVEWGLAGDDLTLVQSRPIVRPSVRRARPPQLLGNFNLVESQPDPLYAMTASLGFMHCIEPGLSDLDVPRWYRAVYPIFQLHGGRLYWNLNSTLGLAGPWKRVMWRHVATMDLRVGQRLRRLVRRGAIVAPRALPFALRLQHLARVALGGHRGWERGDRTRAPDEVMGRACERERAAVRAAAAAEPAGGPGWFDAVGDAAQRGFRGIFNGFYVLMARAAAALLGLRIVTRIFFRDRDARVMLSLLDGVVDRTVQLNRTLLALAQVAARDREARDALVAEDHARVARLAAGEGAFASAYRDFLARFGHRAHGEMELARPRYADDPRLLDRMLAGLVPVALERPAPEIVEPGTPEDPARIPALVAARRRLAVSWWGMVPGADRLLVAAVMKARWRIPAREGWKYYWLQHTLAMRRGLLAAGARMAARLGGPPESIFHLGMDEAEVLARVRAGAPSLADLIARRARAREEAAATPAEPLVWIGAPPIEDDEAHPARPPVALAGTILHGQGIGGGTRRARARHVRSPDQRLAEGEIMIAPFTDPGWTPLFLLASGVVVEAGGTLSHAAVVAREMGLPAVFGIPDLMAQVPDGATIEIDGDAGTVRIC
jgi:phosphohistidine swiveling domain-containing protein